MATIQRYETSQSSPQQVGTRPMQESNDIPRGLNQLAGGAQQYAEGVQQRDRARDIVYVANQSAADRLALNAHLNELEAQAPPDGAGVTDAILKAVDGREQASLTAAPTDQARQFLQQHYAQLRQTVGLQAQGFEAQKRGEHTVRQLSDTVDANAVYLATNPGKFDVIKAETDVTLGTLASSAGMNPAVLEEFKKEAYQTLATSAIAGAMQTNPLGALRALSTGQYDQYFKDPARKAALINQSLAQYTQIENQQYRDEQRALKQDAHAAVIEGAQLAEAGQLTPAWLAANADRLEATPSAYLTLSGQLGKGPTSTSPTLYAEMRTRAATGEDVTEEANAALIGGFMRQEDYDRILSVNGSSGGGPASPYKQGEKYITTSLAKSIYDNVQNYGLGKQQQADALDEFALWAREHKDATPKEVTERYHGIVEAWRASKQLGLRMVPQPRFAVYNNNGLFMTQQTFKQMQQAFDAGDITERELKDQSLIVHTFDQILNPEPVEPAKPAK